MEKMRVILKSLMAKAGHNPYDIKRITGLPAATTYRFLKKNIDQPKIESIRAWCKVYGITEAQLRGEVPIDGIEKPQDQLELKDMLTMPEYEHISNLKRLDDKTRDIVFNMTKRLAVSEPQAEYNSEQDRRHGDRRQQDIFPNPQLRVSDTRYKTPPRQKRLKNPATHATGRYSNKSSQIA